MKQKGFFMKIFLTTLILFFVIKGIAYILFPNFIQSCCQRLMDAPIPQLRTFGWILVLTSFVFWMSFVRHML